MAGDQYEGLDPSFAAKIRALINASGGRVNIKSAFRSVARQQQLWDAAVTKYGSPAAARKWVAPPGKSNHGRGAAVDLGGDLKLAAKLAPSVGLHFPMGHEPWHVEQVGSRASSDPQAYTVPPDMVGDEPPEPVEDLHDPARQFANLLAAITGAGPDSQPPAEGIV